MTPVVTIADLPRMDFGPENAPEGRFGASIASITRGAAPFGLGAMHVRVAPGKRAFPFHNHLAQSEMFLIIEGSGVYRFGKDEYPVKAGDVCTAPSGGPETAHQLINTGAEDLVYFGISTMNDPEIVEYPDSGKFAAIAVKPGKNFFEAHLRVVGRKEETKDYWDGER